MGANGATKLLNKALDLIKQLGGDYGALSTSTPAVLSPDAPVFFPSYEDHPMGDKIRQLEEQLPVLGQRLDRLAADTVHRITSLSNNIPGMIDLRLDTVIEAHAILC